jgi:DNA-binding NarL/FixJ family response regulator
MSYRDLADLNIMTGLSARAREIHRSEPHVERRPRALLVDDSSVTRNLLARILGSTPLKIVAEASSAVDALRLTAELRPDLVIIDALLPGARDKGILKELRELHPAVRIVLSTTRTSQRTCTARDAPAADEYIFRPYHRDRVCKRVTSFCRALPPSGTT